PVRHPPGPADEPADPAGGRPIAPRHVGRGAPRARRTADAGEADARRRRHRRAPLGPLHQRGPVRLPEVQAADDPLEPPGPHAAAVQGLVKAVFDENLVDAGLAARAGEFVSRIRGAATALPYPSDVDEPTLRAMVKTFAGARRGVILIGQDLLQAAGGYAATVTLLDFLL